MVIGWARKAEGGGAEQACGYAADKVRVAACRRAQGAWHLSWPWAGGVMAASGGGWCLLLACAGVIDCIRARDGAPMGGLGMQAAFCSSISLPPCGGAEQQPNMGELLMGLWSVVCGLCFFMHETLFF